MTALTRADLLSLERYAVERPAFRARVIAHKKRRQLALGAHLTLCFEDRLTIQYQVQEMLRIERIFEPGGIDDELAAYNPLIPDGRNWKATLLLEYPDVDERRAALSVLVGIETRVWFEVAGHARVFAIADEDLERSRADKTSSVHFLRFELDAPMVGALRTGAALSAGVDHPAYAAAVEVGAGLREALLADLA
ncbi:MAG TPA: DUF3501 family protein [Plasticicumulans sp.]|nr:MAG: DUF3501 family protein [Xanthomonadales bacterium]HMV37680.1 DUF3501 family protein [Plasticicumulans sp.]HMW40888.1 DUF3501 family protein [Plasticicumulans sp.]HMX53588.1 DUF3501 family protein [Plasticicumulans sp.]